MFESRKWVIGLILGSMVLSGIAIIDKFVFETFMLIATSLTTTIVGWLYSMKLISTSADGGKSRMIIFVALLGFFILIYIAVIEVVTWLISGPLWIYIFILLFLLTILLIHLILNKTAEKKYIERSILEKHAHKVDEEKQKETINNAVLNDEKEELKTIYQLLLENRDKEAIYVEKAGLESPGLDYIKINQKALNYPKLKGYLKMDNSGIFREIYYADEKIWKLNWRSF